MTPHFKSANSPESTLQQIRNGFEMETGYEVKETPLFIYSPSSVSDEPIIIETEQMLEFLNERYVSKAGPRNVFLSDLEEGLNVLKSYSSEAFYNQIDITPQFTATASQFSQSSLVIDFNQGQIDEVSYESNQIIKAADYGFTSSNWEFNETHLTAYYRSGKDDCTLVNNYKRIYCYTESGDITFQLNSNLDEWEITGVESGNTSTSKNNVKELKLNDGSRTIRFYFSPRADIKLTYGADLVLEISNAEEYAITFDEIIEEYEYETGLTTKKQGISETKLNQMKTKEAQEIITMWGMPNVDFGIEVQKNSTSIFNYSTRQEPIGTDIYTTSYIDYLLSKYGEQEKVKVMIKTW